MNPLKKILELDFWILAPTIALMIIGILFIYSAGMNSALQSQSTEYIKQIAWASIGFILMIIMALFDYRKLLYRYITYIYVFFMILLFYTCIFGKYVNGAKSWIGIAGVGIQPSEFAKLAFILFLAYYLEKSQNEKKEWRRFIKALGILAAPMFLILLQPDLGTASVYIPIFLIMCFMANIPPRYIGGLLIFGACAIIFTVLPIWQDYILQKQTPIIRVFTNTNITLLMIIVFSTIAMISLIGNLFFNVKYCYWIAYSAGLISLSLIASMAASRVLKEYQIMRLIVFLNPEVDYYGAGWNIIQSITAIGSGGVSGQGFLQGTQSHHRFLPQQSTDFIFSIIAEELGFTGACFVFFLYLVILIRMVICVFRTSDLFENYMISGVIAMFFYHFIINIGMTMGVMPITGIPLFFLSYGGSSLWTILLSLGVVMSIEIHSRNFKVL